MADKTLQYNSGGQYTVSAAGANAETAVVTGGGRVCVISYTTVGTVACSLYDGTQSTGGTLLWTSATNPSPGSVTTLNLPYTTGLVYKGTSTASQGICISYNAAGVNGN